MKFGTFRISTAEGGRSRSFTILPRETSRWLNSTAGPSAARRRTLGPQSRPLRRALQRRAGKRPAEGRVRRSPRPSSRPHQGALPSNVRDRGPGRRPSAAAIRLKRRIPVEKRLDAALPERQLKKAWRYAAVVPEMFPPAAQHCARPARIAVIFPGSA